VDELVIAIVDKESPQINGIDVSETGEAPTQTEQAILDEFSVKIFCF